MAQPVPCSAPQGQAELVHLSAGGGGAKVWVLCIGADELIEAWSWKPATETHLMGSSQLKLELAWPSFHHTWSSFSSLSR